jgi:hypothetical protein
VALLQRCLQVAQLLHTLSWAKPGILRHQMSSCRPVPVLLLPLLLHLEPLLAMSLLLLLKQPTLQKLPSCLQVPQPTLPLFLQVERIQVTSCLAWLKDSQQDLNSCLLELPHLLPQCPPKVLLLVTSLWAKLKRLLLRLPEHCRPAPLATHPQCLP